MIRRVEPPCGTSPRPAAPRIRHAASRVIRQAARAAKAVSHAWEGFRREGERGQKAERGVENGRHTRKVRGNCAILRHHSVQYCADKSTKIQEHTVGIPWE